VNDGLHPRPGLSQKGRWVKTCGIHGTLLLSHAFVCLIVR
jgi:hypothetical protein